MTVKKILDVSITLIFLVAVCAASCEISITENGSSGNGGLEAEDVNTNELQKEANVNTPQDLFNDFLEMVDELESMDNEDIDDLDDSSVIQLGAPLQRAVAKTHYYDDEILIRITRILKKITSDPNAVSQSEYNLTNNRVERILDEATPETNYLNFRNADDLRPILKNWTSDADTSTACSDLFNQKDEIVVLGENESFNIANYSCPPGTKFVAQSGIHSGQSVLSSKQGNSWIGLRGAIMDGGEDIYRAFSGGLNQNTIGWLELRNYHLHGIYSSQGASDVLIKGMKFKNIAPDSTGQEYGAIFFEDATGITVTESYFEDVASAIRFRHSDGPLEVLNNEALNSGRNFFQCGNCNGGGIRVTGNSMVRTDSHGITMLEDWINIFESNGKSDDWIEVNNNRARGHSQSGSGSFIILGDYGGSYQEAVGNIGVNPGQVGIGIAGGHHIRVEANVMYSSAWDSSNVAYYSANYSPSCGDHIFKESGSFTNNRAHWICGDSKDCNPQALNHAWSDGQCGITNNEIRENVVIDRSITPDVWNQWQR